MLESLVELDYWPLNVKERRNNETAAVGKVNATHETLYSFLQTNFFSTFKMLYYIHT